MGYMLNEKQFKQSMALKRLRNKPGTEEHYEEGPSGTYWEQVRTYGGEGSNQRKSEAKRENQSRIARGQKPSKVYEAGESKFYKGK
ncbi:hypothetical protein [Thiocapsa sp. N5-Cardenillas]|uniref:hypothetical protein n=1 Tax=Thiocapsa sp. N5-Cardenillas TaxID=3137397 RepID=UPI0035B21907